MALSNWDTYALDEKSRPTNGVFVSPLGVQVEIYKNWIYVRDTKAWEDGGGYIEPVIMEIQHGELTYKDIHIHAIRGPQNGIYLCVHTSWWSSKEEDEKYMMIGIGCYGYSDHDWIGVQDGSVEFLKEFLTGLVKDYTISEDMIKDIDYEKGLRFNQGDAYFAKALGFETPATEPGEAEGTILEEMIDNMKEGEKDEE